jgi:hypothetical protein
MYFLTGIYLKMWCIIPEKIRDIIPAAESRKTEISVYGIRFLKMPLFNLKKITICIFIILLYGLSVPVSFASSIKLMHDYHAQSVSFSANWESSPQNFENFQLAGIDMGSLSEKQELIRVASLRSDDYILPETEKGMEKVSFKNLFNVKLKDKSSGMFFLQRTGGESSRYEIDDILLKRQGGNDVLYEHTNYMAFMHVAAAGIIFLLPESVTKWDKSDMSFSTVTDKWARNVKSGPVWDGDDWAINYIGHPYQGAAYYVVARHSGYDWKGSFLFSTILSTFMWEYGFESFAEVPSTQDLVVTPIIGSILGELLLNGEERITENRGRVLGSRLLGDISLFLINPAGSAIKALQKLTKAPARVKTSTAVFYEPRSIYDSRIARSPLSEVNSQFGLRIVFTYN